MTFRSTFLSNEKEIEEQVEKARQHKKIFVMTNGYENLRQSLISRGWIEKLTERQISQMHSWSVKGKLAMAARNHPFNFYWQSYFRPSGNLGGVMPYINTIIRKPPLNFNDKDGLENIAQNYHWFHQDGLTELCVQRTHIVVDKTSRDEFSEDFRRTEFTSFIFFLHEHDDFDSLFANSHISISSECINFALQKIKLLIKIANHDDIDMSEIFDFASKYPRKQNVYLDQIREIKNGSRKFSKESKLDIEVFKAQVRQCVEMILNQWPRMKFDGLNNIWIVKPIGQWGGHGVILMNDLEKILTKTKETSSSKFIVQKYIEKPLLIHRRKFDIRIYFLTFIRDGFVDVWLYRDCYIKFSTPVFTLNNLDRSVHVTNYAVQKNFMNSRDCVPNAVENMWPLVELKKYFESKGVADVWESQIFPGIKKNILAVISASLDVTEMLVNNFELNGADFMIGYDYEPVLIEINWIPDLYFSKVIVDMMTKKLLEDVVKVVVDYQRNPNSKTGDFELIHSFEVPIVLNDLNDLRILGKKIEISKDS